MFLTIKLKQLIIAAIAFSMIAAAFICLDYSGIYDINVSGDAGIFHDTSTSTCVPVIMYHSLLKDPQKSGKFTVTPDRFESDLKYLRENHYHTVVIQDLIDYVYHGISLPEKPIMITFDDGHYNNVYYAYPLLEKYNMRAVLSVVGAYSDASSDAGEENPNYSYITWERMGEVAGSGIFEIQNHSYDLHANNNRIQGSMQKRGESDLAYQIRLKNDLIKLQNKIYAKTGQTATAFTYPFGIISDNSTGTLKSIGFKASLSCAQGMNIITVGNKDCLFRLKRYLRSTESYQKNFFGNIESDIRKAQ